MRRKTEALWHLVNLDTVAGGKVPLMGAFLAQLVERLIRNEQVISSNLIEGSRPRRKGAPGGSALCISIDSAA